MCQGQWRRSDRTASVTLCSDNPVALARIKANVTQRVLAKRLGVTQAYISKVEHQSKVTPKLLAKVKVALKK